MVRIPPAALAILGAVLSLASPVQTRAQQPNAPTVADIVARFRLSTGLVIVSAGNDTVGTGSGFFLSKDGAFVTNWHVVASGTSIAVKRPDGGTYTVKGIVAADRKRDLVILQVEGSGFSPVTLGSVTTLRPGDTVIAIGNPLALETTVSTGVISAFREVEDVKLIQTSAPISPGSSGGALLSMRGDVIGVTSFAMTSGQNLNFAIPVEYVREIATQAGPPRPAMAYTWQDERWPTLPRRDAYKHPAAIRRLYDRFDDLTRITISDIPTSVESMVLASEFSYSGLSLSTSFDLQRDIELTVVSQSERCRFYGTKPDAVILANNDRFRVIADEVAVKPAGTRCLERVRYLVPAGMLARIAATDGVDIRFGTTVVSLQRAGIEALRDFLSRMVAGAGPERLTVGMVSADVQWVLGKPLGFEVRRVADGAVETWKYADQIVIITNGVVSQILPR